MSTPTSAVARPISGNIPSSRVSGPCRPINTIPAVDPRLGCALGHAEMSLSSVCAGCDEWSMILGGPISAARMGWANRRRLLFSARYRGLMRCIFNQTAPQNSVHTARGQCALHNQTSTIVQYPYMYLLRRSIIICIQSVDDEYSQTKILDIIPIRPQPG